jgi:hypothetical protein
MVFVPMMRRLKGAGTGHGGDWQVGCLRKRVFPEYRAHPTRARTAEAYRSLHRTYVRMGKTRLLKLRGGPYDGKTVELEVPANDFWAYANMYNTVKTVSIGGMPRSASMAEYRVVEGADVAEHVGVG